MKLSRGEALALAAALALALCVGVATWLLEAGGPSSKATTVDRTAPSQRPLRARVSHRADPAKQQQPAEQGAAVPGRGAALVERLLAAWSSATDDDDEASRLASELLSLGEGAAGPLLRVLARESAGSHRDRLFDLLRQVPGSVAESGLIAEALSTDAGVSRVIAIEALGERGTDAALAALNQVARTDPEVLVQPFLTTTVPDTNDTSTELPDEVAFTPRMKAMAALGASGNASAIPMLVAVLREEPDQALRMEAATALGRLRSDASAVEALTAAALRDRSPFVRLAALHSLTGVLDPGLLEPLATIAARDSHPGVRVLAARVLDQLNESLRSAELGG